MMRGSNENAQETVMFSPGPTVGCAIEKQSKNAGLLLVLFILMKATAMQQHPVTNETK